MNNIVKSLEPDDETEILSATEVTGNFYRSKRIFADACVFLGRFTLFNPPPPQSSNFEQCDFRNSIVIKNRGIPPSWLAIMSACSFNSFNTSVMHNVLFTTMNAQACSFNGDYVLINCRFDNDKNDRTGGQETSVIPHVLGGRITLFHTISYAPLIIGHRAVIGKGCWFDKGIQADAHLRAYAHSLNRAAHHLTLPVTFEWPVEKDMEPVVVQEMLGEGTTINGCRIRGLEDVIWDGKTDNIQSGMIVGRIRVENLSNNKEFTNFVEVVLHQSAEDRGRDHVTLTLSHFSGVNP